MRCQRKQDDWTDPVGVGEDEIVSVMAGAMFCVGLVVLFAVILKILGWG